MDVPRDPHELKRSRRRRLTLVGAAVVALIAALYSASRLGRAAPGVSTQGLWVDTVKVGDVARELHGVGELVPDDNASRWAAAEADGRVDKKLLEAGAVVKADTVLMQLSNPDVEQASVAANLALEAAQAEYASLEASLQNDLLALRSNAAAVEADRAQAAIQAEVDATLSRDGLLSEITSKQSRVRTDALTVRVKFEQDRVAASERLLTTRLTTGRSEVESHRTLAALKRRDLEAMTVRAGMDGVLQEVVVDVGQRVVRSANLARVIDPNKLKAQLRIPEAQTDDLRMGLRVAVDTHNGIVQGVVSRIAPSAQNGTVTVDVQLAGALPRGARPDMTIDGTIEIERLQAVRHMGRPASGQMEGAVTLFKVSADGTTASKVAVKLGRASANSVQILDGDLQAGDRVVLSDTASWGDRPVVRLR
ncbi:MAG: HlyD family efflux transporter periplasmic adaptor subunit [Vicinamibacterales bacterium]